MATDASDIRASEAGTVSNPSSLTPVEFGDRKHEYPGEDAADVVDWSGPDNNANPHKWPSHKKWTHIVLVSLLALVTNMAPTICVPGINELTADFDVRSATVGTLAITLYSLGLAIGPMAISPLSETYGRLPVYHATNGVFVAFIVATALSRNIAQFIVFRVLSGLAGGTPMALGGGTIADVTVPENRAIAMALFSLGPLAGPILGPVIGGFTAGPLGWRWSFWILAIFSGGILLASALLMRETYPKVLLERKAAHLRNITGNKNLHYNLGSTSYLSPTQAVVAALVRPCSLLVKSPILLVISIYVAFISGTLYLLLTTFADVFEGQYGFNTTISGLPYLGLGAALVMAMVAFRVLSNRIRRQEPLRPESRLILMIWFSPLVSLGLFLYGWTAYYKVHWIVPILGTSIIGFGVFFVLMPAQLYLVDVFGSHSAASALGANNLLRFLANTFLPLAGPPMYKSLGFGSRLRARSAERI
ncbi:hypothetical protein VMCG_10379 [Cytospora schulzeri]|uniref:Major facilitator superfamily (MFS) profile domain-containing protein n=1 Tax=Cytospora schulzeri TaxID=448051 RepID=A0A423VCK1_9PEZI|nr:hypothetical protein VMCG_10379 [Valsa malicola]